MRSNEDPIEFAPGVFWVGAQDVKSGLRTNPFLVLDGEEAVVIDGGSRPDFPRVMIKILATGCRPENIKALIYSHYDPDLCGSVAHFEDIIDVTDLQIVTSSESEQFIRHYNSRSEFALIDNLPNGYRFSSGRTLEFLKIPYCHATGAFVTFDKKTQVLFTGDLFGSYNEPDDELLLKNSCEMNCSIEEILSASNMKCLRKLCPLNNLAAFNRDNMTSCAAVRNALRVIKPFDVQIVAPQHGVLIGSPAGIAKIYELLAAMDDIGIDGIV